jgi:hypothetical protein
LLLIGALASLSLSIVIIVKRRDVMKFLMGAFDELSSVIAKQLGSWSRNPSIVVLNTLPSIIFGLEVWLISAVAL